MTKNEILSKIKEIESENHFQLSEINACISLSNDYTRKQADKLHNVTR